MVGIQNEIRIFFEEFNGGRFGVVGINEVVVYFVDGKEVFPLVELSSVLCNFGIEFFWYTVKCEAVVSGEDELFFEPETFLEFFNVGEKINNLGSDGVDEFRGFQPIITIG